jgi:hypothetical protein
MARAAAYRVNRDRMGFRRNSATHDLYQSSLVVLQERTAGHFHKYSSTILLNLISSIHMLCGSWLQVNAGCIAASNASALGTLAGPFPEVEEKLTNRTAVIVGFSHVAASERHKSTGTEVHFAPAKGAPTHYYSSY